MDKLVFPDGSTIAMASGNLWPSGGHDCHGSIDIYIEALGTEISWQCQLKNNHRGSHQYTIKHDGPDQTIYWKRERKRK